MPRKTLPHKTSGTGMLCGIYALAGAFADSKFPDVNDRDERKLQAQQIFNQLSGIFTGDEYHQELIKHCNKNLYPESTKSDLVQTTRFLTDDHIVVLAKMYADQCGKTCHLNIETQAHANAEIISARWFQSIGVTDVWEITIRNRWNSHWESVIRVLDEDDVSKYGSSLDTFPTTIAKDKHQYNAIEVPVTAGETNVAINEASIANNEAANAADEVDVTSDETDVSDPKLASFEDHLGNPVTLKTYLVPLVVPKRGSPEWYKVSTCTAHSCQLITSPGTQINRDKMPTSKDLVPHLDKGTLYNHRSANFRIRFGSLELNPWLEIQLVIYRSTGNRFADVLHKSSLRFFFGRLLLPPASKSINYVTIDGISNLHLEASEKKDKYLLSFQYQYAVPHNLHIAENTYKAMTEDEKMVARLYENLARPSKRQTVQFVIYRSTAEMDEEADGGFDILLQKIAMNEYATLSMLPYEPYLTRQGFLNIQANSFKSRKHILMDGSPHMAVKAQMEFADLIEAGVQLSFYTEMTAAEERARRVQYENTVHEVRFIKFGNFVLALLKLVDRDTMFDARHLLNPHTEVLLSWTDNSEPNVLSALTFVADDFLQKLPGADLVLISKNKGTKFFGKLAVPLSNLNIAKVSQATIKVIPNNSTYLRMIDAIGLVWDLRTGRQDLWPLLLNHYPKDLKTINVFAEAKVPENESEAALKSISNLPRVALNKSQLHVIHGTKSLTGSLQLVQAPGGTGKTTTLALLTRVYQQTRLCTLLCAPTNTAVDGLCKRYTELFGESFAPLRVYAADVDHESVVLGINRAASSNQMGSEDVVTLEIIQSMVGSQKNNHRRDTGADLLSKCLKRAKSGEYTFQAQYVNGEDEEGQPSYSGPLLNMYEELQRYHNKATDPRQDSFFEWCDEDKRNYKQALQYVKGDVIQSAPIIGTTTNGIGQQLLRQNAGISQEFRGIIIIIDEAHRECEANVYIAMTNLTAYTKVVGIHMIGDVHQGLPVMTYHGAMKPKIKDSSFTQKAYNEFSQRGQLSLFARLISQGFPVLTLDIQYRTHPTILDYPNRRFYDAALLSGDVVKTALDQDLAATCRRILGFKETVSADQLRLQWIEVMGSRSRKSQKSYSRANLETRDWVLQALDELRLHYGETMSKNVAIITPYRRQAEEYRSSQFHLRQASLSDNGEPMKSTAMPTIRTADSAQGGKWEFVILDLVITNANKIQDIGHISDDHRACIALTAAKQALWVVSGSLKGKLLERHRVENKVITPFKPLTRKSLPAILEFREDMIQKTRLLRVQPRASEKAIPADLLLPGEQVPDTKGGRRRDHQR